jgi:hypothetical protein
MITEKLSEIADLLAISPAEGHNPAYPYVDYGGKRFSFRALDGEQAAVLAGVLAATGTEYTLDAPRRIAGDALDAAIVSIAEVIHYDNSPKTVEVLINGLPQAVEMTDGYGTLEIVADGSMSGDMIRVVLDEQEVMIHVL